MNNLAQVQSNITQSIATSGNPKSKAIKIIIGIVLFLIIGGGAFFGKLGTQVIQETPDITGKLTAFMQNVSAEKYDEAYALTTMGFKEATPKETFGKVMKSFGAQYSNFQKLSQTGLTLTKSTDEQDVYQYEGTVTYTDGGTGDAEATLVKEDGVWKIHYIKVTVNQDRVDEYNQKSGDSVMGVSTYRE